MLFVRLIRWIFGWVKFEAEGGFPERMLNLAFTGGVELWDAKHSGIVLSASCPARQYRKMMSFRKRTGMRMRVAERHGAPFFVFKWSRRPGLLVGLGIFALVLNLFAGRVWVVKVRGNEKVNSAVIMDAMEKYGVHEGADLSDMDIRNLQLNALRDLPDLSWCTVNVVGCTAYIDVSERIQGPDMHDEDIPSNIKAAMDGRIVRIEAFSGQTMVKEGDAVVSGMLLVSGVVDTKSGPYLKRSHAKIFAETTREYTVEVPLKEVKYEPSGKAVLRPYLSIFTLNIPLFTDGPLDTETLHASTRHPVELNGVPLPLGIMNHYHYPVIPVTVTRTEEEARNHAMQLLSQYESEELAEAEIKSVEHKGEMRDNVYVLKAVYQCVEDIAAEEFLVVEIPEENQQDVLK